MPLYRVEVGPRENLSDPVAAGVVSEIRSLGAQTPERLRTARLYWIDAEIPAAAMERHARDLFADAVVERCAVNAPLYDAGAARSVEVVRKPGVMDPVVASIRKAFADRGVQAGHIGTGRKFLFDYATPIDTNALLHIARKILANECIEEIHIDTPAPVHSASGKVEFKLVHVPLRGKSEAELVEISKKGCLSLTAAEMKSVQEYFDEIGREPTDAELETVAQTWSEHCRHKTLRGTTEFAGPEGAHRYENLLKETIVHATETIGHRGCLSVFKDNAGVVAFDERWALTFKVETHNHPSAIEPYGGAGTGIGGVIRDTMGTGLGARPIASTDVFCFGLPDTPAEELPPGTLHPRRVMNGVVAGVRDYGNRMGIPTVNGAVHFDPRYVGNPLVYAGSVGLIPREAIAKHPHPGDLIVVLGGRTGRDGIHGATFSSIELSENSEMVSSGAVQIGNAIEEKKVLDVLLKARDEGLFTCVTDCGAGGLSSAVGEMGEHLGATVELDKVPLKYSGLSYAEIWISEAQERMVVSVSPEKWPALERLCQSEDVEGTVIGTFDTDKMLRLNYHGQRVGEVSMDFLHDGIPGVVRTAVWNPPALTTASQAEIRQAVYQTAGVKTGSGVHAAVTADRTPPASVYGPVLKKILSHPTVASKQWIIRQYDHEVQGRTVIKPLVGIKDDGPGDAAVMLPLLHSTRGAALGCGLCPQFTDRDPREMAKLAVDECMRNLVAVGADPAQTYILDNFSWGNTSKPEQLGSLVLCCEGATEAAIAYGTPFISGKDSLNNEYSVRGKTIAIPGTLLISGLSIVEDVRRCVTMDLKEAGNLLYIVGQTDDAMACSHFHLVCGIGIGTGNLPTVDLKVGLQLHKAMHKAIQMESVRACHDLSEGGLAVAAAEMAFAGGLGARIELLKVPSPRQLPLQTLLFSESPTRYLVEVRRDQRQDFEDIFAGLPHACIGSVTESASLQCVGPERELWVDESVEDLKKAWLG